MELDDSSSLDLCKHGLGLSILMYPLFIGWTIILGFLVVVGSLIGLLIGLAVLVLALGYLNSFLAETIWDMATDKKVTSRLFHGVLLFIILFIVNIPMIAMNYLFPHWMISVILFIIYVPIHGYVGLKVAEVFEVAGYEEEEPIYWGD